MRNPYPTIESSCSVPPATAQVPRLKHESSQGRSRLRLAAGVLIITILAGFDVSGQTPTADGFNPGAGATVLALAVQADSKLVVGGSFTTLGWQTRNCLGRVNADGTLDDGFNPSVGHQPGYHPWVSALAVQAEGKILVAGYFTTLAGQPRNHLGRLNADGSLDAVFNPSPSDQVRCLQVLADGKTLVGGDFTSLGGQTCKYLGRLDLNGTLDLGFKPGIDGELYYAKVATMAMQADGKTLIGGNFTSVSGQPRTNIARLDANGVLDDGFSLGANGEVSALAVQADGKVLVCGSFTMLGGQTRNYIGRLNADGTVDSSFDPGANGAVDVLALQADGKILAGGRFTTLGGQTRNNIGRLNADGTLDSTFNPGASGWVVSLAMQADGKTLVGGDFYTLGGQSRSRLGRLNTTSSATEALSYSNSTITWLRGGTSPEVWRTSFDHSSDGSSWISLGAGQRIPGGWQLTGVPVPTNGTLRARGWTSGGYLNGSGWFVETYSGALLLLTQPAGRTNDAGTMATFNGAAAGSQPLAYRWLKNGVPLLDGGNVIGAATTTLTLSSVFGPDGGAYQLAVTNAQGSVTSQVAVLTVVDPIISSQPAPQSLDVGQTATFSVSVTGTVPLSYQWRKDGAAVAQGTGASLTLTNLQSADAGGYSVVVANAHGSVTSTVALLTVNLATLDLGFDPGAGGGYEPKVQSLVVQPDGRILVAGDFLMLGGQIRSNLARLHPEGAVDTGFSLESSGLAASSPVNCLVVQTNAKVVVGGYFFTLGGQARNRIGRLNWDGSVDTGFAAGASSTVLGLAEQADGRTLLCGEFSFLGGENHVGYGRFNADGSLDSAFNRDASTFASDYVLSLAAQVDGKTLMGGRLRRVGTQYRDYIARLNTDGTVDTAFNPGAGWWVWCLVVQPDGKILVGGVFSTLAGQPRNLLGRLNSDGSLDTQFDPGLTGGGVRSLALQADGKILVGGGLTAVQGQARKDLARLNPDGTLDRDFNPGASDPRSSASVYSLSLQANGKILVGGSFTTLGGAARDRIGRLNNTGPATHHLALNGSTLTWLRGGCSPEVWRTAFEVSTNGGASWASLGSGIRIPGGWELTGANVPSNASVRARGFATGGLFNGSGYFVEDYIGPLILVGQPCSRTNETGTTATFSVVAGGTEPIGYQWRFQGTNVVGQTNATLVLTGVTTNVAGLYDVVVTNVWGSLTSGVATLMVVPVLTLGEAVDAPLLTWENGGSGLWTPQRTVTHDGVDAAHSGAITHNQESWMQTSVVGPGPLSFWWKVSSESWDYLEFYTNGVRVARISGEVAWQQQNVTLAAGAQLLRWRYVKDSSGSSGLDRGWVDEVTPPSGPPVIVRQPTNQTVELSGFTTFAVTTSGSLPLSYQWRFYGTNLAGQTTDSLVLSNITINQAGDYTVVVTNSLGSITSAVATLTVIPVLTLGEGLDAPQLTWSTGGNAPWTAQTSVTHDGTDAAQSGAISHTQETWLQTSVVGPGPLSFWWKVSSESGCDYLEFYTNSVRVTRISGEVAWQQVNCTLGAGTHTLRWLYMKDSSVSSGQDRGWVDQVSFAPVIARPVITVNDSSFGIRTNRFGFNVSGPAGQVVVVEGSTNLLNWQSLQTNTLGSGPFYFSDPSTGTWPRRFYRVRVGP